MTDHPITPPIELVRQWSDSSPIQYEDELWAYELFIAHQAARWGADQELEACCDWLDVQETRSPQWFDLRHDACALVSDLRAARRLKPPSLKEQAIKDLDDLEANLKDFGMGFVPITNLRKALEALPND